MGVSKLILLKDEVLALEGRKVKLHSECETLEKELTLKRESLGEVIKRLSVAEPDYKEIERDRIIEVDSYMGRSVSLKTEIENEEEILKNNRDELSRTTNLIVLAKETLKKVTEQLGAFTGEKEKVSERLKALKQDFEDEEKERDVVLAKLDKDIKKAREELRLTTNETEIKKKEIEREERILGLKKRDLEIYTSRMQKKYPKETFTFLDEPLVPR